MPGSMLRSQRFQSEPARNGRFDQQSSKGINDAPPLPDRTQWWSQCQNREQVGAPRILTAGGLTVWLGGLVAVAAYVRWRMRFPKSMYTRTRFPSGRSAPILGLLIFAVTAYLVPTVAWAATTFGSGLVIYVLGAYVVALTVERRRAMRLGLPEPGTNGIVSFAECAVFLAIALPFAVGALGLTVYGIANELGGNRGVGLAALGLGGMAWFIAIVMGLFASPLLLVRRRV
jgi:hypothetical protein